MRPCAVGINIIYLTGLELMSDLKLIGCLPVSGSDFLFCSREEQKLYVQFRHLQIAYIQIKDSFS